MGISTHDCKAVPNCTSISKDVLAWFIFGNEPNNQSKLTGRVFIGCTARCPRMRLWPRLILLSWMVVSSTSLVRYGIVPLVWFSRFFSNFKQVIYFCCTRKQYWTSSWKWVISFQFSKQSWVIHKRCQHVFPIFWHLPSSCQQFLISVCQQNAILPPPNCLHLL
jgi:hypothetical protein